MYDQVIYYTHSQSGFDHTTEDTLAFVLREYPDGGRDLVAFPPGGPTKYVKAYEYNPDRDLAPGHAYWREAGSDAPDFSNLDYVNNGEWIALQREHRAELAKVTKAEDMDEVRARQAEDRRAMKQRLDAKYKRGEEAEHDDVA